MFKNGHLSVFEHSNFVIKSETFVPEVTLQVRIDRLKRCLGSRFLKIEVVRNPKDKDKNIIYIGGNVRAWIEALDLHMIGVEFSKLIPTRILGAFIDKLEEDDKWLIESFYAKVPIPLRRYGCRIVHDRAFTHELVRHRVMSFSQESQRYCNYNQEKFSNQVTFIENLNIYGKLNTFLHYAACWFSEKVYMYMVKHGVAPQHARSILPNSCKTEIYVSGDRDGWEHLFELRTAEGAHPDMKKMMIQLKTSMKDLIDWDGNDWWSITGGPEYESRSNCVL